MSTATNSIALDNQGWLTPNATVTLSPSPNFNQRPPRTEISLLVIHNITLARRTLQTYF
jgi:AmpD protein